MSLHAAFNPAFSRSTRRGRGTNAGRSGGMYSLVVSNGVDIGFLH